MSSGFVSGGTTEQPIERDEEWLRAQQELEASRRLKQEQSRQQDGKTLYEVLQANKAAKQDAFEESIRLKNQFRTLDEDEIEFLDSVLESTRAREEAVKRETTEQLDAFRRLQEEADKAALLSGSGEAAGEEDGRGAGGAAGPLGSPVRGLGEDGSEWGVNSRKRKRFKEKEILKGVKLRKGSSGAGPGPGADVEKSGTVIRRDSSQGTTGATNPGMEKNKEGKTNREVVTKDAELLKAATTMTVEEDKSSKPALAASPPAISTSPPTAQTPRSPTPTTNSSSGSPPPAISLGLAGYSSDED
ncbi:MAG: hypothetical protein MMC33_004309 [Icmadophila ericetorum]|nr:hypothetical protein [Icmadophila ericetorum]